MDQTNDILTTLGSIRENQLRALATQTKPGHIVVGDMIYVFDADGSLVDSANQVRYRGGFIYPIKQRVYATTWPIERGMGVWYRSKVGAWTDLTNYVEFEEPGVSLEVGAAIRPLTRS